MFIPIPKINTYSLPDELKNCDFETLILCTCLAFYEEVANKTILCDLLTRMLLKDMEDFPWTFARITNILEELKRKNILDLQHHLKPQTAHKLLLFMLQLPQGRELAGLLPSRLRTCKVVIPQETVNSVSARIYFYLNDVKALFFYDKLAEPCLFAPYYLHERMDDWFKTLKLELQIKLADLVVSTYLYGSASNSLSFNISDWIKLLEENKHNVYLILQYTLFAELNYEKARSLLPFLPITAMLPLYKGILIFLEASSLQECVDALPEFRLALKEYRKELSIRKIFFNFPEALFFVLCLVKAQTDAVLSSELNKELDKYLSDMDLPLGFNYILLYFCNNINKKETLPTSFFRATQKTEQTVFAKSFVYLFTFLLDRASLNLIELRDFFEKTKNCFVFPAAIAAQIFVKIFPEEQARVFQNYLKKYTLFDFTSLLEFEEDKQWEKRLEAVNSLLLGEEATGKEQSKKKITDKPKRLTWLINTDYLELRPVEQVLSKEGWSTGRNVALFKLKEQMEEYPYITEQDKKIISQAVQVDSWYTSRYYVNTDRALPALVGHPLLLDDKTFQLVNLKLMPPVLSVQQTAKGYVLSLPISSNKAEVRIEHIEANSYAVIQIRPEHLRLHELLGGDTLELPPAAQDRVLKLLHNPHSNVPVVTNIETSMLSENLVQTMPAMRIKRISSREGDGLSFYAVVYPVANSEICFKVGQGNEVFVARIGDTPKRVKRKLLAEKESMQNLLHLCPTLKSTLLTEDYSWELSTPEDAYSVLLELQNTQVKLEWYDGEPLVLSKVLQSSDMKIKVQESRNWFGIKGTVQINEKLVLDMGTLLKKIRNHEGRFIPLADGQVVTLTESFRKILDRIDRSTSEEKEGLMLHPLAVPALEVLFDESEAEIEADKAWKTWQSRLHTLEEPVLVPSLLKADLRPYQVEGYQWLVSLVRLGAGACLADDMGLGKTLQAIALIVHEVALMQTEENEIPQPILIVAPTSVCYNWEQELHRFAPHINVKRVTAVDSKKERAKMIAQLGSGDVFIIGYGLLNTELTALCKQNWKIALFDEAQALKNAQTQRSQASVKLPAQVKIALTGTPVENSIEDIWSIFHVINKGLLGSHKSFIDRFILPVISTDNKKNSARSTLKALIKPFILRRTKTAVLDELPPRIEQTLTIEPSEGERAFYEALRREAVEKLTHLGDDMESKKLHILAELTRLRRACCNPVLIDPHTNLESSKLAAVKELCLELQENNHKVLIFSQFTGHLSIVFDALRDLNMRVFYLDGSTPEKKRGELVTAFQRGQADIFCISLKAGGQGLNLTAADYVIHLDPWWNPAVEDQASDRAHRMGQTRPVTIYRLIMANTVEEKILDLHKSKRELAEDVLSNADSAHKLTSDDLLKLFNE